jgi:hypothetical protein
MVSTDLEQFDTREGRIVFEIKKGQVIWNDNQSRQLVKLSKNGSFILLEKDASNKLRFSYFDIETGKADLEIETGDLSSEKDYALILSWSTPDKIIKLYMDGKLKGSETITSIE